MLILRLQRKLAAEGNSTGKQSLSMRYSAHTTPYHSCDSRDYCGHGRPTIQAGTSASLAAHGKSAPRACRQHWAAMHASELDGLAFGIYQQRVLTRRCLCFLGLLEGIGGIFRGSIPLPRQNAKKSSHKIAICVTKQEAAWPNKDNAVLLASLVRSKAPPLPQGTHAFRVPPLLLSSAKRCGVGNKHA